MSEEQLNVKLIELKELIRLKGNMPDNINKVLLLCFLKFFKGNAEKALQRLIASMEIRKTYSNIFYSRDPMDLQLRRLINQVEMFLMPKMTSDNNRIMIIKLIDFNPENLNFENALTVFSMVYDTTIIMREEFELADGEILIFDLNGLTARHLTRLSFSSLRCFFRYMIEAHPMRVKSIHLINCSSMLDKLMMLIRPLMGSKAMQIMHFHAPNSSTLFDFVPRELLPNELNGTGGSLDEPKWYWIRRTEDHRDFLLDNDQWKFNESKDENACKDSTIEESFAYMGFC